MKNRIFYKFALLLMVVFNTLVNAQYGGEILPPEPETPQSGDIGGMIPPSSPIDNYLGLLLIVVVGLVMYINKQRKVI